MSNILGKSWPFINVHWPNTIWCSDYNNSCYKLLFKTIVGDSETGVNENFLEKIIVTAFRSKHRFFLEHDFHVNLKAKKQWYSIKSQ